MNFLEEFSLNQEFNDLKLILIQKEGFEKKLNDLEFFIKKLDNLIKKLFKSKNIKISILIFNDIKNLYNFIISKIIGIYEELGNFDEKILDLKILKEKKVNISSKDIKLEEYLDFINQYDILNNLGGFYE